MRQKPLTGLTEIKVGNCLNTSTRVGRVDLAIRRIKATILATAAILLSTQVPAFAQGDSTAAGENELSLFNAIILGLVEGLTEYLPVSSTGHLLVTNRILGIGATEESLAAIETYAIAIQIGAIVAVLLLYRDRIQSMVTGVFTKDSDGQKLSFAVIAAFVPTAAIAFVVSDWVQEQLFGPIPIAAAWLIGGIGILVFAAKKFDAGTALENITTRQAFLIGLTQTLALWPGTSRSLVTIIAGVALGLSLAAAVEFSFLLGLITLSAATVWSLLQDGSELFVEFGYLNPAIGLVVAFFAAVVSIRFMVSWLKSKSFAVFGYYRIVIGILAFGAISIGWL